MSPPKETPPPSGKPKGAKSSRRGKANSSRQTRSSQPLGDSPSGDLAQPLSASPSGNLPLGGNSALLGSITSSSSSSAAQPLGTSPSCDLPLGGSSVLLVSNHSSRSTRTHPSSGDAPEGRSSRPVNNNSSPSTGRASPAKDRPIDVGQLSQPIRLPCAVMINKDGKVMGDPFRSTPGWAVKVDLDAGAHGQPSIGLDFEFSKADARSEKARDQNTFAVGWEPGVKIGGKWMMEDLQILEATNPPDPSELTVTFPPAINDLLKKTKGNQEILASSLVCATFISNVHKSSPMKVDWALALNGDEGKIAHANLQSMYQGESNNYQVTLWFVNRKLPLARFRTVCLDPLVDAVTDHTPPFHKFLDQDNEPMIDFNLEQIHPVGSGLYRPYPTVLDPTNRRVETWFGNLENFVLRKTVRWESIKTLHTRASNEKKNKVSIPFTQEGPRSPRGAPPRAPKAPAVSEMLKLEDRQTLHRLD